MIKVFRVGKTRRDHKSGAWARCITNKLKRADWNNEKTMIRSNSHTGAGHFPYSTCNGKRNKQK